MLARFGNLFWASTLEQLMLECPIGMHPYFSLSPPFRSYGNISASSSLVVFQRSYRLHGNSGPGLTLNGTNDLCRFPAQDHVGADSKVPSVIYYDRSGMAKACGLEALHESVVEQAEEAGWEKAEW